MGAVVVLDDAHLPADGDGAQGLEHHAGEGDLDDGEDLRRHLGRADDQHRLGAGVLAGCAVGGGGVGDPGVDTPGAAARFTSG